ncbi:MFS transporter, partial [Burkholderia cenocepacia]|nr:MFS transporter [Burkholderia cenocepacia]
LAFLPLVGLPWVVKFLWAPVVDNRWSPRIGRRRSWMLPMQTIVVLCLVSLAQIGMTVPTASSPTAQPAVATV